MAKSAFWHSQICVAGYFLFFAIIHSHAAAQFEQPPSYLKFVFNGTDFPVEDYYDYIVVGGGTAGCPLAATLSAGYKVLLLERGGVSYGRPNLMTQEGFLATLIEADAFDSPAQAFTSEDGVPNARGRVLGGSSAINAGFYSRADPNFYARSGINWDLRATNESFKWVEKEVVFQPELRNWQSAVRDGLLEAGVGPYNGFTLDHVVGTKIGGSTFDSSGRRHSSADLLNYAKAANIRVAVHATVERILLEQKEEQLAAVGVVYRDARGGYHHAMVRDGGEVIASAGAIGSPQLLMVSGIGSRAYLSSWGIPVAHHLPQVGQLLYDNPRNGISMVPARPVEHSLIQVVGITERETGVYLEAASNVIPFALPSRSVFIRKSSSPIYLTVATLMEKIAEPQSAGWLRLASRDVRVNPIVRFNYLTNRADVERCVGGMRKIAEVLRTRSMDYLKFRSSRRRRWGWFGGGGGGGRGGIDVAGAAAGQTTTGPHSDAEVEVEQLRFVGPSLPVDVSDNAAMAEFCRQTVSTIWHYHGGCLVGRVVDPHLRVIGVDALRVIDGSIFAASPGTNPQATLMMLGRYYGLKIIRDRSRSSES